MYGFGADDETEPSVQGPQNPKWFRETITKVSDENKELRAKLEALEVRQRQQEVREALTAKGYAPQVADLYQGDPNKVDDWLGTYGAALARTGGEAAEQGQGVQGTPQTVVSPESQAAMQQMAAAGQDGAASLSGEDQLVALLRGAKTEEEYNDILRANGNKFV